MFRHTLGEDLKVGANLTWGPGFDYQKQFFSGRDDPVSQPSHLLHYDVEVSGFGSHRSGHLVLLRLKEQIPPGGDSYLHWPTLGLNTLRWAKHQGAVCGPAHSGWGLIVDSAELPNYIVPRFDGIGANEYIVDVTHEVPGPDGKPVPAVDFMSTVDTPVRRRAQHLVSHVERRVPHPHRRGDRFPLRLRRPGRHGAVLREAGRRAGLWRLVRGASAGTRVRLRRQEPSDGVPGRRRAGGRAGERAPAPARAYRSGAGESGGAAPGAARVRPRAAPRVLLGPGARPHRGHRRRAGRTRRQRSSGGPPDARSRRRAAGADVRGPDRTKQLAGGADPAVVAHQSDLGTGRRPACARLAPECRVVSEGRGPVLEPEASVHRE